MNTAVWPHDGSVLVADDQPLEFRHRTQVGVGGEVHLDQGPLGLADGGEKVVGSQGLAHLGRADVVSRHAVGFQPDAHREGSRPQDFGALDTCDRRKPRLHHPHQVVRDLVLLEDVGGEAQIGRGELAVGRLHVDDGHLGLRGQIAAHLVDF
jgi:hypothetical protein